MLAVPRLLEQHGLSVDDIGLWELNEAFACPVLYCRDTLGIDNANLNVNGGAIAIAIGHRQSSVLSRTIKHLPTWSASTGCHRHYLQTD